MCQKLKVYIIIISIVKNYVAWQTLMEVLGKKWQISRKEGGGIGEIKDYSSITLVLSYLCGRTGNLAPDLWNNAK